MTNPVSGMEEGAVVQGFASFRYRLTNAPSVWNSVGIAQAMDNHVNEEKL